MKKQLIAIGLLSFLIAPSVVLGDGDACAPIVSEGMTEAELMAAKADMMGSSECMNQRLGSIEATSHGHGVSFYGSFRTGLKFGSGDSDVKDFTSRWGFRGSSEVAEGLTAGFRYESTMDTTNATTAGHRHAKVTITDADDGTLSTLSRASDKDESGGGRLSYVNLSGGFGTVTLGQIWSASGTHYGFAVDPSYVNGSFGGSNGRNANSISYSSSAGDVSFQIDKVTGAAEKIELGATAAFGPVGVGLGYWSSDIDDSGFTGVALSTGAAGVSLTIGLGSSDDKDGVSSDKSILKVSGALGDSGFAYGLQVTNGETDAGDQNLVVLTNSLGSGASLIFEHLDPGVGDNSSLLGLKVDF